MESIGLTPADFKQLPKDGARFEALVCQLLEAMDYRILEKPAVGTEGGRDVLVERRLKDDMGERRERVVVQCKHRAHSGRAVGDEEVGVWRNAMTRHKAHGYLLVTDTRVTENLSWSLREFTKDETNFPRWAAFWDVDDIILRLNKHPDVRDSFFTPVLYSKGINALDAGRWEEALICFEVLEAGQPGYRNVADLVIWLRQFITDRQSKLGEKSRENDMLLASLLSDPVVKPYLREAEIAGLDMTQSLPNTRGALLESIVCQVIERDRRCLSCENGQMPSTEELCRLLSYLGWYMLNEGVTSCDAAGAAAVIEEILAEVSVTLYEVEDVLDWLAATYWLRRTDLSTFEFRDSCIVDILAAMELKEQIGSFCSPESYDLERILGFGPGSDPAKWRNAIVFLIGMLTSDQTVELVKALLDADLVPLANRCVAEIRPRLQPMALSIIYAYIAKLAEERRQ